MDRVSRALYAVVPAGIDDPARPSGGNRYDRRLLDALASRAWRVHERPAGGAWPEPSVADRAALDRLLGGVPDGSAVLIDGLIASAAAAVVAAHLRRLRVVVLLHMPLGTAGERALLPRCAAVVTSSRWVAERLRTGGPDEGHVEGRADASAGPGDGAGHPARLVVAEPGVDPADPVIPSAGGGRLLAVAVLAPHKGQDVLIAALHRIADLPWTCTVAGSAAVDPAYADRLRAEASGLGDRVRFVGPLAGPDLDRAYAATDLLIHPSRSETYGMVLTEALARAIPVLATDVGGIPDAVGRAATGRPPGRLVAPDDVAGLAAALREWLTDPDCRARWRTAAAARRRTLTGWSVTAELVEQALVAEGPEQAAGRGAGAGAGGGAGVPAQAGTRPGAR